MKYKLHQLPIETKLAALPREARRSTRIETHGEVSTWFMKDLAVRTKLLADAANCTFAVESETGWLHKTLHFTVAGTQKELWQFGELLYTAVSQANGDPF